VLVRKHWPHTRWSQDQFAQGSYSTFAQATQLGDRALLGEPVTNKVLFAGGGDHGARLCSSDGVRMHRESAKQTV
jgi:hypothetical protein